MLNPKQERFCQEYLVDLNATQAAIRAGYSHRTARAMGAENLTKPDIRALVAELQKARSERTQITQDQVVTEYAKTAFANLMDYFTVQRDGSAYIDLSRMTRGKLAGIERKKKST